MIKYSCDRCKKDLTDYDYHGVLVDGKNMILCSKCHKKLKLMRKEVDRMFLRGEEFEFTPPEKPQQMEVVGFNSHDCETRYRCPECGKEYGSWDFFNKHMLPKTVFKCEDCGTQLILPE
jgi:predicted SprT family Zn-dependent metalloprotease